MSQFYDGSTDNDYIRFGPDGFKNILSVTQVTVSPMRLTVRCFVRGM